MPRTTEIEHNAMVSRALATDRPQQDWVPNQSLKTQEPGVHYQNQQTMAYSNAVLPAPSIAYPTGVEGELFHDIVHLYQQETQAPLSLCIQAALGVGAFVQQGLFDIESPNGQITPASLLLFGVLESAGGKSAVLNKFMAPIDEYIEAHKSERQGLEEQYNLQKERWEKTRKDLERKLAKAQTEATVQAAEADLKEQREQGEAGTEAEAKPDSGSTKYQEAMDRVKVLEAALNSHSKKAPQPLPPMGLGILSETTPAGIPKFIKDNRIQSLAIVSAEAEEFLFKGIKNQSSLLNKGFSGEKTSKHLATRGNESHNIPITSLIFGQPYIMEKALRGNDDRMRATGTLSRCLFTCPPSTIGFQHRWVHKPNDDTSSRIGRPKAEQRYRHWVQSRLNLNLEWFASGTSCERMELSNDALDIWYLGRVELATQLQDGGRYAEFKDHGNRLPEQWLRVALVLHGYNQHVAEKVSAQTMRLAIGLVNSFSTEFQNVFRQPSQEEQDAMRLLKWINDKRSQNMRYIGKSFATTASPVRPVARLNNALLMLQNSGEVGVLNIDCHDQQGRRTKSMTIIDLFPTTPPNQHALDVAVHQARTLNNG